MDQDTEDFLALLDGKATLTITMRLADGEEQKHPLRLTPATLSRLRQCESIAQATMEAIRILDEQRWMPRPVVEITAQDIVTATQALGERTWS